MEKLKHEGTCKEVHPKMSHEEWENDQENLITGEEEELDLGALQETIIWDV